MTEKQNIECKKSWRDEYLQWICAFANTEGGTLIIGKDDKGQTVELDNTKKLLEDIPSKIKSHLGIISSVNFRDDGDRLSIWNEGALPSGLTIESLKTEHNSKPPNPLIADVCFKAGYIDTWGRGTLKIYKACQEAGLPEPSIIEKDGGIEVTLYKIDISEKLRRSFVETSQKMNDDINHNLELMSSNYGVFIDFLAMDTDSTSEKLRRNFGETSEEFRKNFGDKKAVLLVLITADPSISASAAAKFLGVSPRSVQTYFNDLKENVLERIGPDKGGFWKITVE